MVTQPQVLQVLKSVIDPDFGKDIVELGFVQNVVIDAGDVSFDVVLTTPACPVKDRFEVQCRELVSGIPGVTSVKVSMKADTRAAQQNSRAPQQSLISGVRNVIAVASGKGGVGKSTATANLAAALALSGAKVGVLDADIYGPSMVLMFGITSDPEILPDRTLAPVTVFGGIKVVSMAMFAESGKATIWRGPMASQMIQNFVHRVHWGELDYLLIDFPPGTGDIQLTLTQQCPLSGAVVVTTPQEVSLADVRKGLQMFESVAVPVLGVVENMSWFECDGCGKRHHIFRQGGGERISRQLGLPFLGGIPLEPAVSDSGDEGRPLLAMNPNSSAARAFADIAGKVAQALAVLSATATSFIGRFDLSWDEVEADNSLVPTDHPGPGSHPVRLCKDSRNAICIVWSDNAVTRVAAHDLRLACPCARCVDEWTHKPLLDPSTIPLDIVPTRIYTVGRYALGISWSDGHNSGIHSWESLKG